jgi:hypothetical protein
MTNITKIYIILIFSTLSFSFVSAQNKNSFAGVRIGYALPMGQFASHDFETGGYALLGKSVGLEAAWFVSPKIGFGIDISTQSFGFASGYFAEDLKENTPEYISPVDMLSGPYKLKIFIGGAYYKVNIGKKFKTTFKIMGGVSEARTPDQFYGVDVFMQGKIYWWKTGSLDRTFTFLTGVSFEYKLYENVGLILQTDFTYAKAAFTYNNPSGTSSYTDQLNIPVFKLQPGINIYF